MDFFGAVDAYHQGLLDVGGVGESNDSSARNSPFSAALDASTALNPNSQDVMVARADGITRASVSTRPSASIFGGQGAVIDLGADPDPHAGHRKAQRHALGRHQDVGIAAHAALRPAATRAASSRAARSAW